MIDEVWEYLLFNASFDVLLFVLLLFVLLILDFLLAGF
jgi:hypothetical protein